MYEVNLTRTSKKQFIASVRVKMKEKNWTMADLAREIDRPVSSVKGFFYNSSKPNRFMAAEIAKALGIRSRDWR